jgi:hypothetical protein
MWVVVLGSHLRYHSAACWGPFPDEESATRFAAFITAEVDPAKALRVMEPTAEVLNWREHIAPAITTESPS